MVRPHPCGVVWGWVGRGVRSGLGIGRKRAGDESEEGWGWVRRGLGMSRKRAGDESEEGWDESEEGWG